MFPSLDNRNIAYTDLGGVEISTVSLFGINHQFQAGGPPLLYETMVFGCVFHEQELRWSTEKEALAGHENVVKQVRKVICEPMPGHSELDFIRARLPFLPDLSWWKDGRNICVWLPPLLIMLMVISIITIIVLHHEH